MRTPLDALMNYLATIDGARPTLFVALVAFTIFPRATAAVMAALVAIHMLWMSP